jgi:predicted phage terminase large subunit-like protein
VVGQRWVRSGANRYLIDQKRGRWTFTQTIEQMLEWADPSSFCGSLVHRRLIEDKANGTAIIDVLREKIAGLKPVNPTISKEARYRAVTPEIESGNAYLPHPSEAPWVNDLLSELRDAPRGSHDDQADALAQALAGLRDVGRGSVAAPGRRLVVVGPNHPQVPGANLFRRQG